MEKYIVELTSEERKELTELVSKGKAAAKRITRARILLQSDASADVWRIFWMCINALTIPFGRLERECDCWNVRRNGLHKGIDWQFTTEDVRIKLKRLYPQLQP